MNFKKIKSYIKFCAESDENTLIDRTHDFQRVIGHFGAKINNFIIFIKRKNLHGRQNNQCTVRQTSPTICKRGS